MLRASHLLEPSVDFETIYIPFSKKLRKPSTSCHQAILFAQQQKSTKTRTWRTKLFTEETVYLGDKR